MPAGIKGIYDAHGRLIASFTDRWGRFIGQARTTGTNGSLYVPMEGGEFFTWIVPQVGLRARYPSIWYEYPYIRWGPDRPGGGGRPGIPEAAILQVDFFYGLF